MRTVVIIQARMTSTRLPGKVLADLDGRPLLSQLIRRLRGMTQADELMIATTARPSDDPVAELARAENVRCFRGEEDHVLSRYAGAAREAKAELVVRVTADCPLIDPAESDRVVHALKGAPGGADYASNVMRRTYPRGLDTEAFHADVLERMMRLAHGREAQEHVTWLVNRERPDLFVRLSVEDGENNGDLRWTVDTAEDLGMVRRVYSELGLGDTPRPYREVLAHVRAHPDIAAMNADIAQREG